MCISLGQVLCLGFFILVGRNLGIDHGFAFSHFSIERDTNQTIERLNGRRLGEIEITVQTVDGEIWSKRKILEQREMK